MNNNTNCYVYKAKPSIVGYSTFFFASAKWLRVSANVESAKSVYLVYLMYMNACSNGIVDQSWCFLIGTFKYIHVAVKVNLSCLH